MLVIACHLRGAVVRETVLFLRTRGEERTVSWTEDEPTNSQSHISAFSNTFSLPTHQIQQLGQWPYISNNDSDDTPLVSLFHF